MQISQETLSADAVDFIDDEHIAGLLHQPKPEPSGVRDIISQSLSRQPLTPEQTAMLLLCDDEEIIEEIFDAARRLKREVYGKRIVIFAPLYIGSRCINDCAYCAFKRSNPKAVRTTLNTDEIRSQVLALVNMGHKRLILVFGEHPEYNPAAIARCIETVYTVSTPTGSIRRVNMNAAPMTRDGFATIKQAGIGAYQIFQETYNHSIYREVHPAGTAKGNYLWRLDALSRAIEAGQTDVGIGALFGLADWRGDVLGIVTHAQHLRAKYGFGPHTVSFPRLTPACGVQLQHAKLVHDYDFKRIIAILRLAIPYAGMVLTARESPQVRRETLELGVSQIDAGTRIELGGYTGEAKEQNPENEQFTIADTRPLDEVVAELLQNGYIPSFCTTCYRVGRTGGEFMSLAEPGKIKKFCSANAILTLAEYLTDYAKEETQKIGEQLIETELKSLDENPQKSKLIKRLNDIQTTDKRDLYF